MGKRQTLDTQNVDRHQNEFDKSYHPRSIDTDFGKLAEKVISRRGFLIGSAAFLMSLGALKTVSALAATNHFGFDAVAANGLDTVTVPKGYSWHVVAKWGQPMWSRSIEFDQATRGTGDSQELAFGDNNDGMWLFNDDGRNVLVVNNEYVNIKIIHPDTSKPFTDDAVRKSKAAHGISVVEIAEKDGTWSIVKDSSYNRRITADTPMEITGPARGHGLLKTAADPTGATSLGTWANCGKGHTPWMTYLTCEENFHGYFSSSDPEIKINSAFKRYGIGPKDRGYAWKTADERFDISKHPNEANRVGYIVEVDPLDPTSTPKKRTALGRFKHENAELVLVANGQVVVYMGDDERGEFLYKFVSDGRYVEDGDNTNLLETGVLFAAKFADDGKGEWVPLTPESTGMSSAEICIHTRMAASAVGATTMDRPEWIAANPKKAEIYCSLTNNENRGKMPNKGGDPTPVGGPNPRANNIYGQIVHWMPDGGDHLSTAFSWDLYVVAGNPGVHSDANAGSSNVNPDNMFNSPDGLTFDRNGMLWIQTDGVYSNAGDFGGQGNNQMLVGDPVTGEIRRFLVGPKECEVTGIAWSADRRTMFVGIQHPGEKGNSHFPDGGDTTPRSAVIAVKRDDDDLIG